MKSTRPGKLNIPTEEESLRRQAALRELLDKPSARSASPKEPDVPPVKEEEPMPESAQTQQCTRCKQWVPKEALPLHTMEEAVTDLQAKLDDVQSGIIEAGGGVAERVKSFIPRAQDIEAALKPVRDALGRLDFTPAPDDVREHIKGCKGCAAKWEPIFTPKVETAPAPAPAAPAEPAAVPATPKRKVFDWVPTPMKLRAYGIQAVPNEGGAILRVPEQKADFVEEQQVVPGCRWVKDPDGWRYACEEA